MPVRPILWSRPRDALERARPFLLTAMLPIIVLATGSLVLEYGFRLAGATRAVLHVVEAVALVALMLDAPIRLVLARDRWAMLRFRWLEYTIALLYAALVAIYHFADVPGKEDLALRTTHAAIVLSLVLRVTAAYRYLSTLHLRPALLLVGSFLTLIAFGTGLLLVPAATAEGQAETSVMDALFTAASAVCVTGLTVVDTGVHWSRPGQYVVLGLIQLGGLGLMTYGSVFAMFMWRGLRLRESIVLREVVSHDLVAEIWRVVLFILLATVLAEAAGALLMMNLWTRTCTGDVLSVPGRVYYSVFHSVSAFCNAGFSLYPKNLMAVGSTWGTNLVFPLLIITGGLGFGVLYNLLRLVRYGLFGHRRGTPLVKRRLTLQSKLALVVTAGLLAGGTLLAYVFETYPGRTRDWQVTAYLPAGGVAGAAPASAARGGVTPTVGGVTGDEQSPLGRSWADRLVNAWFLATTSRTAGFNTTDTTRLSPPTKFLVVALMFIGASPGSTGGGIKTVTFAVICLGIWSALRGRPHAQAFHRTIPWGIVTRALALLAVSAIWVALVTMIICAWGLGEGARFTFLDVLFETMSAFGTVGLSTGTTPLLNTFGRLLIVATMFLGRVGPITLLVTMQSRAEAAARFTYPPENVATS